jgi:hypothetical protein
VDTLTGAIRELHVGEAPRPTEVELTAQEAEVLRALPDAERVAELARLRGLGMTGKRARKVAIRQRRKARDR